MRRNKIGIIAVIALFISSVFIYMFQTDYFNIKLKVVDIVTTDGKCINAKLYIPKDASEDHKMAAVITTGGGDNEYTRVEMINTELARRGYVVVSFSPYNHGTSDIATASDYGVSEVIRYVRSLGFVDDTSIGIMGHSRMAAYMLKEVSEEQLVKSVLSIEYAQGYDAFREYNAETTINIGLIGNRYNEYATDPLGLLTAEEIKKAFGTDEIQPNVLYGDVAENTVRKIYLTDSTDSAYAFSQEVIESVVDYFDLTLKNCENLKPRGYIWKYVELFSLISVVAMVVIMIETAIYLCGKMVGKSNALREKQPVLYTKEERKKDKWLMYVVIAIGAISYIPLYMLGKRILSANIIFPQNSTNGELIWAFFMCLFEMAIAITWMKKKKTSNSGLEDMIFEQPGKIIKYFGVAAATFILLYITLLIKNSVWGQIYNFLEVNFSIINSRKLMAGLTYWPVFAVYFIANGIFQIRFCSFHTEKRGGDIWNGILFNTLGMLLLKIINLSGFVFCGKALFHWGRFAFGPINYMIFALPIVGIINSIFYKRTGKIYLGAFMNAFLFTWLSLSCNAFYYS